MTRRNLWAWLLGLVMFCGANLPLALEGADEGFQPLGLLLTWQQDPTTTMTIDWHTPAEPQRASQLEYRQKGADSWQAAEGDARPFPHTDRTVHRVELTGLQPGTTYEFRLDPAGRTYRLETMPADLSEPVRIALGGDTMHRREDFEKTNREAMKHDPHFMVWGGDLAYADGRPDRVGRWHDWFAAVRDTLVAEDGRVVPVVLGIGNHEVQGGYVRRDHQDTDEHRAKVAPFFFGLFAFPGQPGYNTLDFGDYLSIIMLDSQHANPVAGPQTEWLEEQLVARKEVPHVFPVYHVPAYSSHRSPEGNVAKLVREHWVPLFEQHGIEVAFENHDHTYKRTHPLRGGQVDESGIVYLGDGAWGVGTRPGDQRDQWYINTFASKQHFILATLHGDKRSFVAIDNTGKVIDRYPNNQE